jgi:hypothetical protein
MGVRRVKGTKARNAFEAQTFAKIHKITEPAGSSESWRGEARQARSDAHARGEWVGWLGRTEEDGLEHHGYCALARRLMLLRSSSARFCTENSKITLSQTRQLATRQKL